MSESTGSARRLAARAGHPPPAQRRGRSADRLAATVPRTPGGADPDTVRDVLLRAGLDPHRVPPDALADLIRSAPANTGLDGWAEQVKAAHPGWFALPPRSAPQNRRSS